MSTTSNTTSSGGVGFGTLLTILFIALKLTHYIDWSWWWVLSPVWITALLLFLILILCGVAAWVSTR